MRVYFSYNIIGANVSKNRQKLTRAVNRSQPRWLTKVNKSEQKLTSKGGNMIRYISLSQAAEEQNLKVSTLRKYIKQGKLKAIKDGNRYYITPEEYDVFNISRIIGETARSPEELRKLVLHIVNTSKGRELDINEEIIKDMTTKMSGGNENDKQKN